MKIILMTDVPKLGKQGTVVQVPDGYARNYIIPKGLGIEASAGRLKELEQQHQLDEKRKEQNEEKAVKIKEKIDGKMVVIQAKCGEGGKLFGAVTSKEIADGLKKGFKVDVDKKRIEISEPIRHLGEYSVKIKIHQKAHAEITVKVEEHNG
ncbi:MAG: 50S ribosomal protein L9 [Syntrophomonadaceae bacterium]|nr:50S ribosomal protein L9 [Syntrophomonadaceae bacterium]